MQNARDRVYVTLRDRLAAVNRARTMVLRGVTRPGVLVEENELASAYQPVDAFCLRWTGLSVDATGSLPLVTMVCEIRYATDGDSGNGGVGGGGCVWGRGGGLVGGGLRAPEEVPEVSAVWGAGWAGSGGAQGGAGGEVEFGRWGKLQLGVAAGSQQMNLLRTASGATANGSGGVAAAAVPLMAGSTASSLNVGATAAAQF